MFATMDFLDSQGRLTISAGQRLPHGFMPKDGFARDELEAQEKLREIAIQRLGQSRETEDRLKYNQLMYDYHRMMSLHYAFAYLCLEAHEELKDGANNTGR